MPLLDRQAFADPTLPVPSWRNIKGAVRGLMGMATPPDPYEEAGKMVQQGRAGDYLGALETGFGAMPTTGAIRARNIAQLRDELAQAHPNVDFFVSGKDAGPLTVNKVVVPPEIRGQGLGASFMNDVADYADSVGVPVALSPSSDFGGNKSKLIDWYKSLGFMPNKGRMADLSISETMLRQPRKVKE
jgi:GNAT superfamily N-acetyltransferase